MKSGNKTTFIRLLKILHFVLTVLLFWVFQRSFYMVWFDSENVQRFYFIYYVLYVVTLYFLMKVYYAYDLEYSKITSLIYAQFLADFISAVVAYAVFAIAFYVHFFSPWPMLLLVVTQLALNIVWSTVAYWYYHKVNGCINTAVICGTGEAPKLMDEISQHSDIFCVSKVLKESEINDDNIGEKLRGFAALFVTEVDETKRNKIAKYCVSNGITGYFTPHIGDILFAGGEYVPAISIPMFRVSRSEPRPDYLIVKRILDILLSALLLILLSPLFIVTAIAIKICDGGPVFYKQVRLTKGGKTFKILKFRSMKVDAEKDGIARLSTENDDRITPVGKIIRSCRIDELPQLINIIAGSMSFVGPRPERPEIAEQYEKELATFNLRLQVKAGLTGTAQVYGRYNSDPYEKLQMDLLYINRMSIAEDIKLFFATIRILFLKESTSGVEEGKITAQK